MIAFSCSCGQKFKVKPEYAGRSAKCPTCKQPLTVPQPETAVLPAGPIDGPPSSLHDGGVEGGVTLESAARSGHKTVGEVLAQRVNKSERYLIEDEIARGGMGAVLRAVDCDIRREVAVKFLLDQADPKKKLRFIEEAQITGQLEHPNIPPVHELGVDKQKHLFFSMKMVKGRSLAQVLDELRQEPKTAEKKYPLARLLTIFVNICNALDYAHARGVVHRDLKPANIMVGDFGEVYVMDWGLAKVLASGGRPPPGEAPATDSAASPGGLRPPLAASIMTSRASEADLTQDGAIVGTPVYMPPEQATGDVGAIDQRSDVYSLGAILYELLTLQPPVDRDAGFLAVLVRVGEGQIIPPEQRDPRRTKAGKVPKELAAITKKAMAKEKADRYPSVEALRRDIELYQEGRSVSAKQDTAGEMLWKLVKRNKGASAATAAALVLISAIVTVGYKYNYEARVTAEEAQRKAEAANAEYLNEQREKERRTREALPALVQTARVLTNDQLFREAIDQANLVLGYDPGNADALLVKAQARLGQKDFAGARADLEEYLRQRPTDRQAQQLAQLCAQDKIDESVLFALAQVLQQQRSFGAASPLLRVVAEKFRAREKLLPMYQKQINDKWPGAGGRLRLWANGQFALDFLQFQRVNSLESLKGLPLDRANFEGCRQIIDLSPLQGMPLTWLNFRDCHQVQDLAPLKGLPLSWLSLQGCGQVQDLAPLQGLPLTFLNLRDCRQVQDLTPLAGLSLNQLNLEDCKQITDLTPLKKLTKLTSLNLAGCDQLTDLTPIKDLPLTNLGLAHCPRIKDLTPLKGLPLTALSVEASGVRDLTPLKEMQLTAVHLTPKHFSKDQMNILRQMKSLRRIGLNWEPINNWPAEEFWKKYDARAFK